MARADPNPTSQTPNEPRPIPEPQVQAPSQTPTTTLLTTLPPPYLPPDSPPSNLNRDPSTYFQPRAQPAPPPQAQAQAQAQDPNYIPPSYYAPPLRPQTTNPLVSRATNGNTAAARTLDDRPVKYTCTRDCWLLAAFVGSLVIVVIVLGAYFGVKIKRG